MSAHSPQDTVERALQAAPCDDCIVIAEETSSANLRWAGNSLTTNGVSRSRRLTVIAISRGSSGASAGVVSRSGVRDDQVSEVAAEAAAAAADAPPAEDARPLLTPAETGQAAAAWAAWADPPSATQIGVLTGVAGDLGGAFGRAAATGRLLYGFAEHSVTTTYLGTSTGIRLRHDQPTGKLELNAKSADLTRSAWAGAGTRDFADVDVEQLDAVLEQRLGWAQRRVELPAGRYETLLPPSALADLMIYLYWSAGAKDVLDGRTVFSRPGGGTRVGERLAQMPLTLRSSPAEPGLECEPFVLAHASSRMSSVFDNGLPLRPTEWIAAGELAALPSTRHSAQLAGLPVTPPIENLILDARDGAGSIEDMIASTRRGLLVTCLWYIREVDPQTLLLTGLTRDGVYLVENGEVAGAVNNFRFNESPVALLGRIAEAGQTVRTLPREWNDYFTHAAMPPVRVEGFNMSSVSQAS
jgi:predicted Zn-dependent protease